MSSQCLWKVVWIRYRIYHCPSKQCAITLRCLTNILKDYKSDGSRDRPYLTVKPLADDLGLTVDHHCDRDDEDCVKVSTNDFTLAFISHCILVGCY